MEGKGLFALEDIPQGAVFWVFQVENPIPVLGHDAARPNRALNRQQMESSTHEELAAMLLGGLYLDESELFVDLGDGTQFANHSNDPNSETFYS